MKIKPVQYIIIAFIAVALLVSFKIYNDYRKKSLNSIINYTPSNLEYLEITVRGSEPWNTDKQEPAKKLKTFLNQYKVKKLSVAKCPGGDNSIAKRNIFDVLYRLKGEDNAEFFTVFENCIYSLESGKRYEVTNGPIDMEWIRNYKGEFQK